MHKTSSTQSSARAGVPHTEALSFDVETLRFPLERQLAKELRAAATVAKAAAPEPADVRATRLARSMRVSEGHAPRPYLAARAMAGRLGVEQELELFEADDRESALVHTMSNPVLLEIQPRLLALLDDAAMRAHWGHELGHFVAHGDRTYAAVVDAPPTEQEELVARFRLAREITADRVALVACGDFDALVRLWMCAATGLPGDDLTWDNGAFVAQCEFLLGDDAAELPASRLPQVVRVRAAQLFSQSTTFRELTGNGVGKLRLDDVNAEVERFVDRVDVIYNTLDPPLHELHDCALAATVLVANADDDFADVEKETIERLFAPLLGDWRDCLSMDVAVPRFLEMVPVIAQAGVDHHLALFHVLTHVMAADGVIAPTEVSAILSIGEALGSADTYRALLVPTLETLRAPQELVSSPRWPLPPSPSRSDPPLAIFARGVQRRGEATVSMRRLLRLARATRRTTGALERIEAELSRARLDADVDLAKVHLDHRFHVTSRDAQTDLPPASLVNPPEPTKSNLERALTRLRDKLVSGDGRSPSVRLRKIVKKRVFDLFALERLAAGRATEVRDAVLNGRSAALVSASRAGTDTEATACAGHLLALSREHLLRYEQTGAHDLYVGYPVVLGEVREDNRSEGYLVRSPLVLHPVDLQRDGRGASGFRVVPRKQDVPVANQSLVRLIFNKKNFTLPDELLEELDALAASEGAADAVVAKLNEVGCDIYWKHAELKRFGDWRVDAEAPARLEVEECALLGLFPQSSSDLLQDYDGLLTELADPKQEIGRVLGTAEVLLPDELAPSSEHQPAAVAADVQPVVNADPSQREVIRVSRQHRALVMDGPPGTGKSQVIVNLVSDALRRGERVAVVTEKRAALDVVSQRLEGLGLRQAVAVVHDVHDDRKPLYAQIAARFDNFAPFGFDSDEANRTAQNAERTRETLNWRAEALSKETAGTKLCVGELHALVSGLRVPDAPGHPELAKVPQRSLTRVLDLVSDLRADVDIWGVDSPWRHADGSTQRPSLADAGPDELAAKEKAFSHAIACAEHYATLSDDVDVDGVVAAAKVLRSMDQKRPRNLDGTDLALFREVTTRAVGDEGLRAASENILQVWTDGEGPMLRLEERVQWQVPEATARAMAVLLHWFGRFWRFFLWRWWMARRAIRQLVAANWAQRSEESLSKAFLSEVQDHIDATKGWGAVEEAFQHARLGHYLPATASAVAPLADRVASYVKLGRQLAKHSAKLERAGAWPELNEDWDLESWGETLSARLALLSARDKLTQATAVLRDMFPRMASVPSAAEIGVLLERFREDASRVVRSDRDIRDMETVLPSARSLLDTLAELLPDAPGADWRKVVLRTWALAQLATTEGKDRKVQTLGTLGDDREVARSRDALEELEKELSEIEVERITSELDKVQLLRERAPQKYKRRSPRQAAREALLKECRKKRRLLTLRSFVRRFATQGLLDILPVWLLSPETIAILFPREAFFDLVIFDEASQCTVESGLPVFLRGKRVVIAGDEKQMPPSAYFKLSTGDDEEERLTEDEADQEAPRDVLEAESLLSLARSRVAHSGLDWHYRCRDESLIAFSNHAFYHGQLMTIPDTAGPAADSSLRWVRVEGGEYVDGANEVEADAVVDIVHELLARSPQPTVGVVTFNLKHRRAVLDAIDRRVFDDEGFGALWEEAMGNDSLDQRPFVKNLESVQGDERDVILFSLGHAPKERTRDGKKEYYVPARFGPLGRRGGERRLNVAISRAKQESIVVASFDVAMLSVANSKHEGPKLLKRFLEFAEHKSQGRHAAAGRVLDLVRETRHSLHRREARMPIESFVPLATQVALALEEHGVPHQLDVGTSGFRIPIAVHQPEDPTRFALAVLTDEGREDVGAFERHVHRPAVLRMRGWDVMYVTSATWRRRREHVLNEIFERVPNVRGALENEVWRAFREKLKAVPKEVPAPRTTIEPTKASKAQEPPAKAPPVPADENLPDWAQAIEPPRFARALIHIARHGSLSETELFNIVGGPRQGRKFAREIDNLTNVLPFRVELSVAGTAKTYLRR